MQHPWAANVPTILLSLERTLEKEAATAGVGEGDALGSAVEGGGGEDDEENEDGQGKSEKEEDRR